jgi:hypothetical protein
VLQASSQPIVVSFDGELDASLIDTSSVQLERQVGDSNEPVAVQMKIAMNPHTLLVTPATPLAVGNYRLTLGTANGTTLADVNGRALVQQSSIEFSVTQAP